MEEAGLSPVQTKRVPCGLGISAITNFFLSGESPSLIHVFNGGKSVLFVQGGDLYCFGENNKKSLGVKTDKGIYKPKRLEYLPCNAGIEALASGEGHVVALDKVGQVYSWGDNEWGQLGDGTREGPKEKPCIVKLPYIKNIACGYRYTLALDDTNKAWYWGCLDGGVLKSNYSFPVQTVPLCIIPSYIVSMSCGGFHAGILTDDGHIMTWGWNGYGQLGHGHTKTVDAPRIVANIEPNIVYIACGRNSTLILDTDARIAIFGQTYTGNILSPRYIETKKPVVAAAMGWRYDVFAILDEDSYVYYWGNKVKLSEPTLLECKSIVDVFANKDTPIVYPPEAALIVSQKMATTSVIQEVAKGEADEQFAESTKSNGSGTSTGEDAKKICKQSGEDAKKFCKQSLLNVNYDRLTGRKRKYDGEPLMEYITSTASTLQIIENRIKESDADEDFLFGKYIGSRLRKLNPSDKAEIKFQIERLFYEKTKSDASSNCSNIAEETVLTVKEDSDQVLDIDVSDKTTV